MAWCWFPWLHSLSKWIHPTESCQTNFKKKIQKNTAYFAKLLSKLEIFWWLPTITDLLKLGCLNAQVEVTINQRTWSQKRNVTHFSRASFFLDGKWFKRLLSLSSPCLHQTDIKLNVKRKKTFGAQMQRTWFIIILGSWHIRIIQNTANPHEITTEKIWMHVYIYFHLFDHPLHRPAFPK